MTDDREHTGRRPKVPPSHDAHGKESVDRRTLEQQQFEDLMIDATIDEANPEPVEVRREITGITEVADRAAAAVDLIDPRFSRVARAVARVVVGHFHTDRMREANEALRAAAGEPNELRAAIDELAKEMRERDHKVRNDLTARAELLDAAISDHQLADAELHARLEARVGFLSKAVFGAIAFFFGSAIALGTCLVTTGDLRGSTRTRLEHVERDVQELRGGQLEIWRRFFPIPAVPALSPGDVP